MSWHGSWTDGRTDGQAERQADGTYRFPLYSTGLWPLLFPLGALPCLPDSYHHEILDQGKGTNDQLTISCLWATGLKSNKITRSN